MINSFIRKDIRKVLSKCQRVGNESEISNIIKIMDMYGMVVYPCVKKIKKYDTGLYRHSINVCYLAYITSEACLLDDESISHVVVGACLHDIGKILLPIKLIKYKGKFNNEQISLIRGHPELGYRYIVERYPDIKKEILNIIIRHHNRVNGDGYPDLADEIPNLKEQIVAVCDFFEAYTAKRVYHGARSNNEGITKLLNEVKHGRFEKKLIKLFIKRVERST